MHFCGILLLVCFIIGFVIDSWTEETSLGAMESAVTDSKLSSRHQALHTPPTTIAHSERGINPDA
jgi:hypothetical protein